MVGIASRLVRHEICSSKLGLKLVPILVFTEYPEISDKVVEAYRAVLRDEKTDKALLATLLEIPSNRFIADLMKVHFQLWKLSLDGVAQSLPCVIRQRVGERPNSHFQGEEPFEENLGERAENRI